MPEMLPAHRRTVILVTHRIQTVKEYVTMEVQLPGARIVEFKSGTLIYRTDNSAGSAACETTSLFTLHLAPESGPAAVLPVCVQRP
jgi:energy-coupling factor transporter ATP-binding protein EcfA2